ncbi:hypothetical protein GCM10011345_05720 [Gemmobacter megaterium]|nr:hypothetical protein GCM10011345_05720 [Gemmobacter megaterium]
MGMAGIVVIDRHPIEFRAKVGLDAAHQIAGVFGEVGKIGGIFWRNDKAELVAIVLAAIKEGISIGAVLRGGIELATFAIARGAVALDVAQMGGPFAALPRALDVPGFDDDAAHSGCAVTPPARQGSGADIGRATATLDARTFARPRCLPALSGRTR